MIPGPGSGENPPQQGWRVLLGLGNPGSDYVGTRHNVGFEVLDLLAARLGLEWKAEGRALRAADTTRKVVLLKPTTYMNRSGIALRHAWLDYGLAEAEQLFVITDDFNLDLGALRLRAAGSPGGHNGLASLEEQLGTDVYPRMRIGVGEPGSDSVDFVLSKFSVAQQPTVEETLETASWAAEDWVGGTSLEELQTRYNRRKPQAGAE